MLGETIKVNHKSPNEFTTYPLYPSGSIVSICIDNGDAGIGITLLYNVARQLYTVYRLAPYEDKILVFPYECALEWSPA